MDSGVRCQDGIATHTIGLGYSNPGYPINSSTIRIHNILSNHLLRHDREIGSLRVLAPSTRLDTEAVLRIVDCRRTTGAEKPQNHPPDGRGKASKQHPMDEPRR
jgi:hypothetical protein